MKKIIIPLFIAVLALTIITSGKEKVTVTLDNSLNTAQQAASIIIDRKSLGMEDDQTVTSVKVMKKDAEWSIPFQLDDMNEDGKWDELFFQLDLGGKQSVEVTVEIGSASTKPIEFTKTVDAIIDSRPREPWIVNKPAWESELMTYCTYGSSQLDLIGKTVNRLSLEYFYGKEPHSQHIYANDYGQDFLLTANTMSAHAIFIKEANGNIARPWTTNSYSIMKKIPRDASYETRVISRGPMRAIVKTLVKNWQTDLGTYEFEILYSIESKKRYTTIELKMTKFPGNADDIRFGAGMRQIYEDFFYRYKQEYLTAIARDVTESGILDKLIARAIVITKHYETEEIYLPNDPALKDIPNNGPNYGVFFPKGKLELKYAVVGAWEKDGGVVSPEQWTSYLNEVSNEVGRPLEIKSIK